MVPALSEEGALAGVAADDGAADAPAGDHQVAALATVLREGASVVAVVAQEGDEAEVAAVGADDEVGAGGAVQGGAAPVDGAGGAAARGGVAPGASSVVASGVAVEGVLP